MITVAELVEDLGGNVLSRIAGSSDTPVPIRQVVVVDQSESAEVSPGDLVIGIGVVPGSNADRLLAHLAVAGAAGLVTKQSVARQIAAEADRLGVAVLGVPAGAQWAQVILLISSVTSRERFGACDGRLWGTGAGDLFAIANEVAERIEAPITIEDPQSRVIAFSRGQEGADEARRMTILGRRVPDDQQSAFRSKGVFQRLARQPSPIFIEPNGIPNHASPRVAIAVRAGQELLGSIWAMVAAPLSSEAEQRLVEASHFVGLHLLRHSLSDDGSRLESELLQTLLTGGRLAVEAAERLQLNGPAFAVVAAAPAVSRDLAEGQLLRLRDLMSMHLSVLRHVPATVAGGNAYSVLTLPAAADRIGDSIRGILERLVKRSQSVLDSDVMVGVGSVACSPLTVSTSKAHADQVLRVLRNESRAGVAEIGEVSSRVLLLKMSESLASDLGVLPQPIKVLQRYDVDNGTCYLSSLDAYLRAFGTVDEAAKQLNVHANTVRYRLKQIQSMTGLDLSDADERLALTIQLRLVTEGGGSPAPYLPIRRKSRRST